MLDAPMMWPQRYMLALIVGASLAVGCTRDPNVLKWRDLKRGDQYFEGHKNSEAFIEYSRALQRDPNFADAYARLGRLFVSEGNRLRAWQNYQRAANLAPENIPLQIEAGGILLLARRFEDARRLADGVLAKEPGNLLALVLRANSLVGLENMDSAITLMEEAVRLAPGEAEFYSNLGSLQASTGAILEAERTYLKAIEVAPTSAKARIPIGNFYWAAGRPRDAETHLLKAVELEPSNVLAHRALATFYLGSGQPLKAEAPLRFVADASRDPDQKIALADYYIVTGRPAQGLEMLSRLSQDPASYLKARIRIAAAEYSAGRRDEARQIVDEVLGKSPDFGPAILLKARFALAKGNRDDALKLATRATVVQDDFIEALFLVGQLNAQDGDAFQAGEAFRKILEINPFSKSARIELSRLMARNGEVVGAAEVLEPVLRRVPEDLKTQLALLNALFERRDLRQVELQLADMRQKYPSSPQVLALTGTLFALKGDYPSARRWYDEALRADPTLLGASSGLIGLDLQTKRPAEARKRAEALSAANPARVEPLHLLAKTYVATHDLDKAEATLRRAIEIRPDDFDSYAMLGQLLYRGGRLAEGRAEFEKVLKVRPRSVDANTMIGIILRREGRTDEAIERYKKALEIDPQAAVAANNLAWIYADRGVNLDQTVILAKVARKRLPEVAEVADTLGWAYYRNGHPNLLKLAVPLLQEAVQKEPQNPSFRYHLGAALGKSGRTVEARRELQEALRLSPDFHGAAESKRILATLQ